MLDDERVIAHLDRGKQTIIDGFWHLRNVVSVGMGAREIDGDRTDQPAIRVGVAKKRKPGHLRSDEMLPPTLDINGTTYRVDVVEVGEAVSFTFPPDWTYSTLTRPLRPGISVGNSTSTSPGGGFFLGTLGCFVRDKNGDVAILSNAHVLANLNNLDPRNNQITQPIPDLDSHGLPLNTVASLINYTQWSQSVLANNVADGAFARLVDQASNAYSETPINNRIGAPSPTHKAAGLFFAGNEHCSAGWICKIHNVLAALGVSMMTPGSSLNAGEYLFLSNIEKVGARSGYSSTQIDDLSATVKVRMETGRTITFKDCLGTGRMGWPGDSGSLVCIGGTGADWAPLNNPEGDCTILGSVGQMYNLPLTTDIAFADRIRDDFLSMTRLGSLLIDLFYLNAAVVQSRSETSATNDFEKAGARSLYDKYHNFVQGALDNPRDPAFVVKQEHLDDTAQAINGAALHMTSDESQALADIYNQVIVRTLGMTYDQLLTFMNDRTVYDSVLNRLSTVPTIVTKGVISG